MSAKAIPAFLNQAQATCLQCYSSGDHAHLLDFAEEASFKKALAECGDGLLKFVMVELSTSEDCGDNETAIARIDRAIEDLVTVKTELINIADDEDIADTTQIQKS